MRLLAVIVVTLAAPLAATAQPALSLQEALLRAKPAVALIVAEVGGEVAVRCSAGAGVTKVTPPPFRETGTGWFVGSSGWLVTNAHVVSSAHRPPSFIVSERSARAIREACPGNAETASARPVVEASLSVLLPNGFKLPATVVKYSAPAVAGQMSAQDLALLRIEASDMPTLRLGDSASLQIGDSIHIVGFPGVVLGHELLNASAKMEASITNGAVSGFREDRANQPVIQTDAPAAWGNSGGPALDEAGDVVGVLTLASMGADADGALVQGFNFVIPSAAVARFLEGTPLPRGDTSRFNAAWYPGLYYYFLGNHRRARGYLAEANRLVPELPDVRRVIADNEARLKLQPWLPWRRVAVGMLVFSAAGYALLLVHRWWRNRFRIGPSEVARLVDSPEPPVILDVRDTATFAKSPVRIPRSVHAPLEGLEADRLPADPTRTIVAYCT
jgi:S1-C subfamily serine protease